MATKKTEAIKNKRFLTSIKKGEYLLIVASNSGELNKLFFFTSDSVYIQAKAM
jgi:hypothetical protein